MANRFLATLGMTTVIGKEKEERGAALPLLFLPSLS